MKIQNLRSLNATELKIIKDELNQVSKKIDAILTRDDLTLNISVIGDNGKLNVYLIPEKLSKILSNFDKNTNINSAGIFMGFLMRRNFYLSLEGAEFLLKKKVIHDKNILSVDKEGEKSILYGNPIKKKMISDLSPHLKKNSLLMILNKDRELIALALSKVGFIEFESLKSEDLVANNLVDKGYYLRKKQ